MSAAVRPAGQKSLPVSTFRAEFAGDLSLTTTAGSKKLLWAALFSLWVQLPSPSQKSRAWAPCGAEESRKSKLGTGLEAGHFPCEPREGKLDGGFNYSSAPQQLGTILKTRTLTCHFLHSFSLSWDTLTQTKAQLQSGFRWGSKLICGLQNNMVLWVGLQVRLNKSFLRLEVLSDSEANVKWRGWFGSYALRRCACSETAVHNLTLVNPAQKCICTESQSAQKRS